MVKQLAVGAGMGSILVAILVGASEYRAGNLSGGDEWPDWTTECQDIAEVHQTLTDSGQWEQADKLWDAGNLYCGDW